VGENVPDEQCLAWEIDLGNQAIVVSSDVEHNIRSYPISVAKVCRISERLSQRAPLATRYQLSSGAVEFGRSAVKLLIAL